MSRIESKYYKIEVKYWLNFIVYLHLRSLHRLTLNRVSFVDRALVLRFCPVLQRPSAVAVAQDSFCSTVIIKIL